MQKKYLGHISINNPLDTCGYLIKSNKRDESLKLEKAVIEKMVTFR